MVRAGARVISGEALLCANLGFGLRLVSILGGKRHTLLFDTGPEGAIFLRNCRALGIRLGEVEAIAVTHGHWDHMAALPVTIDSILAHGGRVTVHVNPGIFNERAARLGNGKIVRVANVPLPSELDRHGATVINHPAERLLLDGHFYYSGEIPRITPFECAVVVTAPKASIGPVSVATSTPRIGKINLIDIGSLTEYMADYSALALLNLAGRGMEARVAVSA